jgi:DNA processing protein
MKQEAAILQLMLTTGIGERTIARIRRDLSDREIAIEDFPALDDATLVGWFDLKPDLIEPFRKKRDEAVRMADYLAESRITMLLAGTEGYPAALMLRLGPTAPPVLFARGNLSVLTLPAVGFCGARNCSEQGMMLTVNYAGFLAKRGVNVASGYAPGIDTAAHSGAIAVGGVTTIVAASGILQFGLRAGMDGMVDETNTLVLSQFPPEQTWQAHSAMIRNRTICGLVKAMILIESGPGGGTYATGSESLTLGVPLYVVKFPEPPSTAEGNAYFLTRTEHHLDPNVPAEVALKGLVG